MSHKVTCTRRIQFCAGHRVMGHESKCAHLHGHNYVVLLTAEGIQSEVDSIDRVVDFSVLKARMGKWIEDNWDHGFILNEKDDAGKKACLLFSAIMCEELCRTNFAQKLYLMPHNPTAEGMALHLLEVIGPKELQGLDVRLIKVVVHETENCQAEVSLDIDE